MKIIHIISGLGLGGAENTLYNLVKYNRDKNKHIVISLSNKKFYEKKFNSIDVNIINLDFKNYFLKSIFILLKTLKKIKPDIIQSWMYHAEFLTIILKLIGYKKIFWNIRNSTPYSKNFKLKTKILIFINSLFSHIVPHKIISCSSLASKNHINIGYDKTKLIDIFNGVDLKRFKIRNKITRKKNEIIIGCVARWHPQKDYLNLIKSLNLLIHKNIYNWKCYLVGKGLDYQNTEVVMLIKKYGLHKHVKLMGPIEKVENFYNKIDFLVLPSKDGEGFPNVLAESYASGVMCISTDVGDAKRIINCKKYLVKPGNSYKLYKSILKMFNDQKRISVQNKLILRNRIKNKFSMKKMITKYNTVWKND